jgi:hypothetical protein
VPRDRAGSFEPVRRAGLTDGSVRE